MGHAVTNGHQRPALRLEWDADSEFAGLVVRVRRPSIEDRLWIEESDQVTSKERLFGIIDRLAAALIEWNHTDTITGEPIPVTAEGLRSIDEPMLTAVFVEWATATTRRRSPLPPTDTEMADIPMDPLPDTPESNPGTSPAPD